MISVKDDTARGIGVLFCDLAFIIMAFFDDTVRIVAFVICFPIALIALECFKKIQMTKDGCLVKLLWTEKFYPWSAFQTIRLLDFRKCATKSRGGAHYSEGILFLQNGSRIFPSKQIPLRFYFFTIRFAAADFISNSRRNGLIRRRNSVRRYLSSIPIALTGQNSCPRWKNGV